MIFQPWNDFSRTRVMALIAALETKRLVGIVANIVPPSRNLAVFNNDERPTRLPTWRERSVEDQGIVTSMPPGESPPKGSMLRFPGLLLIALATLGVVLGAH